MISTPEAVLELSKTSNKILSENNPSKIRDFITVLIKNIFELNMPKKDPVLLLNGRIYKDIIEIRRSAYNILQRYQVGDKVLDEDKKFIEELFSYHPIALSKLSSMTNILIGIHRDGENETMCFMVEKQGEFADISYIKAIKGFLQHKEADAEQDALCQLQETKDKIITILIKVLKDNPLMIKHLTQQLQLFCPHRSADTKTIKFYMKNLLAITEKYPAISEYTISLSIEKFLEIEFESELDKLDNLMSEFINFLHKSYSPSIFRHILSVFKTHILTTYQTLYIQHIILNLCNFSSTNQELFLSLLIKEIYSLKQTSASSAYIISFLLVYPDLSIICIKHLLYFCLKISKKPLKIQHCKDVMKYLVFLLALKSEYLQEEMIRKKTEKLLKKYGLLKNMPLHEGVDYTEIIALAGYCGDLCFCTLYLPFHGDMPDFKLCSVYFSQNLLLTQHKKRKRCMSIDLPKEFFTRKRIFSIDETKIMDKNDCASSVTTVGS
ncbi:hypothetical protein SteCoe_13175 [Stentor coeruleus]|uniref:Uncharacterized protein n=1 Tax=Stentor coeruleus TaxID=5963 RepID=A0A1R2C907_9CILI|nr:hypothetical protein SteCoe_13175 [Stentor coeruleus]